MDRARAYWHPCAGDEGEGVRAADLRVAPRPPVLGKCRARTRIGSTTGCDLERDCSPQRCWATTSRETFAFTVRRAIGVQSACNKAKINTGQWPPRGRGSQGHAHGRRQVSQADSAGPIPSQCSTENLCSTMEWGTALTTGRMLRQIRRVVTQAVNRTTRG